MGDESLLSAAAANRRGTASDCTAISAAQPAACGDARACCEVCAG